MALRSAEKENLGKIYFLSLVAVDKFGIPEKHKFIYDILSEDYDFEGTDVSFIGAQELLKFYKTHNSETLKSDPDILDLTEFFILKHPSSSFIIDEVPSPKQRGVLGSKYINFH